MNKIPGVSALKPMTFTKAQFKYRDIQCSLDL